MPAEPIVTITIIDDDGDFRRSLEMLLTTTTNYRVRSFASAEQFLSDYPPVGPGCLLIDLLMGSMSGLDLALELNQRRCPVRFAIITGNATDPLALQALEAGATGILEKPFRRYELLTLIEEALATGDSVSATDIN